MTTRDEERQIAEWSAIAERFIRILAPTLRATPQDRFSVISVCRTEVFVTTHPMADLDAMSRDMHVGSDTFPAEMPPDTAARVYRVVIVALMPNAQAPLEIDEVHASYASLVVFDNGPVAQA
jgi:hypothetical protein